MTTCDLRVCRVVKYGPADMIERFESNTNNRNFMFFFQLNVFEFTDLEDLQIFLKRYIYLVSPVLSVIYFLVAMWS